MSQKREMEERREESVRRKGRKKREMGELGGREE